MTSHRFRIALVALFATTAFSAACSSSPEVPDDNPAEMAAADAEAEAELQKTFVQANDALDAGDWSRAAALYGEVIDADPERWDAHMNRGIALMKDLEFDAATDAFEDAIHHGGGDEPIVYFNLGNLYQERGLYEPAIDAYRHSMAVAGSVDYDTLLNISACFTFLNAHDKARQTIDRALKLNPDDPRGHLTLGTLKYSDDRPEEALEVFDELLASHPDLGPAHYNRAFVLMRMEKLEEAREGFQTYLEVAPDGPYVTQSESNIDTIDNALSR